MTCPSHHPDLPWVACESLRPAPHDVHIGRTGSPSTWVSWPEDIADDGAGLPTPQQRRDAVRARHLADQQRWERDADLRIT